MDMQPGHSSSNGTWHMVSVLNDGTCWGQRGRKGALPQDGTQVRLGLHGANLISGEATFGCGIGLDGEKENAASKPSFSTSFIITGNLPLNQYRRLVLAVAELPFRSAWRRLLCESCIYIDDTLHLVAFPGTACPILPAWE